MNRTEFIALTAVILFVAFVLGWFAHWILHRFSRVKGADMGEIDALASQVQEAEEQRDQAVAYYQQRERELTNALNQTEAELSAAMDGLRAAREEAEDLRTWIERTHQSGRVPAPAPAPPHEMPAPPRETAAPPAAPSRGTVPPPPPPPVDPEPSAEPAFSARSRRPVASQPEPEPAPEPDTAADNDAEPMPVFHRR